MESFRITWFDDRGVDFRIEEVETWKSMQQKMADPPLIAVAALIQVWNNRCDRGRFEFYDIWKRPESEEEDRHCGPETKPGQMVRFMRPTSGWAHDIEAAQVLTLGDTYEVRIVDVHSSWTSLKLKGFPGWFNSVMFDHV